MDGEKEAGEVTVSRSQLEGDGEEADRHQCATLCDHFHSSVHDKENSPMMRAALCAQVSKVYRFQTEDRRWLLVREQMSETPISFWLPKHFLSAVIREHADRIQEVTDLGELSPDWAKLRRDVIDHCQHLMDDYQDTLDALQPLAASRCFKSSSSKSDQQLQFVPTNLHSQRMKVTEDTHTQGVWYDVITFGAPADHHQGFKHGGLKRLLLPKHLGVTHSSVSYSADESRRARELLVSVDELQPLLFGRAEQLLAVSMETDAARLQEALDALTQQTELFVHALKDELVRSALLERRCLSRCGHAYWEGGAQEGHAHHDNNQRDEEEEEEEEEWDIAWANVAKSLNCIIVMVDRLQGREDRPQEVTSQQEAEADRKSQNAGSSPSSSWQEQLLPLVVTLRDCVREAMMKAQAAMTFVVLQGAAAATLGTGSLNLLRRRHAVFSQTLSAVVCGFMLKLYGSLEDPEFLQQLHQVGVLVQFEGLLSTYGDELAMLEDMEVGVADLSSVSFSIVESKSDEVDDLLPTLRGAWGSVVVQVPLPPESFGSLPSELKESLIPVESVLFNIGINQQQSLADRFGDISLQERLNRQSSEKLQRYCRLLDHSGTDRAGMASLPDLLSSLERSLDSRKRKNVEVLWIAAAVCRLVKGVRLTSCKSAKDRTAMSVTLEQCLVLQERHLLAQRHFGSALDCMRRTGCRLENVQKNVGNRKFAFSGVQLLTFPKLYRPPDGSYG